MERGDASGEKTPPHLLEPRSPELPGQRFRRREVGHRFRKVPVGFRSSAHPAAESGQDVVKVSEIEPAEEDAFGQRELQKGQASSGTQHSPSFPEGALPRGYVANAEPHRRGVEGRIRMRQMLRIYAEEVPTISLFFRGSAFAYVAELKGPAKAAPESNPAWNIHEWEFH